MAGEEEQVTVTLEPDLFPAGGEIEKKVEANGHDTKTAPIAPVDELRAQFTEAQAETDRERTQRHAAEQRAANAERDAARAREDAAGARSEVIESQFASVESGLSAAEAEVEAAKRDIRIAGEAGDYDKQSEAYDRLATARANHVRLNEAKADLQTRKTKASDPEERRAPQQRQPDRIAVDDPVEAYLHGRSEPTATWLRAHPDWVTDQKKNAKLTAAHYDAAGEGIMVDTPEYFAHVEKFIGLKPNGTTNGNGQQKPAPRRQAAPVAPGAASGGGISGGGREVVLTRGEALAATDGTHVYNYDDPSGQKRFRKGDPIGVQEFARRKLEMTRQGQYDRTYVEQ